MGSKAFDGDRYAQACRDAAEAQGVGTFARVGRHYGLSVEVWQTGGFTMVAAVRLPGGRLATVTREAGWMLMVSESEDAWDQWDDPTHPDPVLVFDGSDRRPTVLDVVRAIQRAGVEVSS